MLVEDIDAAIDREVSSRISEVLPLLLGRLIRRDSLVACERHDRLLFPYVRSQIGLTRARRNYNHADSCFLPSVSHTGHLIESEPETALRLAQVTRDEARRAYRSTPCTCWVRHR